MKSQGIRTVTENVYLLINATEHNLDKTFAAR